MCFAVCLFSSLEYANFLVFVGTCVSLATSHCRSVSFYIALWVVSVTNSAFLLFWWVPAHITDLALFSSDFMFITDSAHHQRTQMFIPISVFFANIAALCIFISVHGTEPDVATEADQDHHGPAILPGHQPVQQKAALHGGESTGWPVVGHCQGGRESVGVSVSVCLRVSVSLCVAVSLFVCSCESVGVSVSVCLCVDVSLFVCQARHESVCV